MTDSASRPPVTLDPAFAELREHYAAGKLVIFAGAGVSAAAGLPGWKRLAGAARAPGALAILELEELNLSEVADFVGRRTPSDAEKARVLEKIRGTHDLTSLSKRPFLLELIVQSQDKLTSGEMNAARLYELATEDWLDSRKEGELRVLRPQRLAFARGVARALFSRGQGTVTHREVTQFVLEVLGDGYTGLNADEAAQEVRTAVFLAHDALRALSLRLVPGRPGR